MPFKIELNEYGQIVRTPFNLSDSFYEGQINGELDLLKSDGKVLSGCSVWTRKGTKVADIAWFSNELWKKQKEKTEATMAPEICGEVSSMSNTDYEMNQKRKFYFEQGAKEFWFCDDYENMSFYSPKRKLKKSILFPEFPHRVEI